MKRSKNRVAGDRRQHPGAASRPAGAPTLRYAALSFIVAAGLYLIAFYAAELPEISALVGHSWRRFEFLRLAVVPDAIVSGWFGAGGAWSLADRVPVLSGAAALWSVAVATGWLVLRATGVAAQFDAVESIVYSAGVGASFVSLYVLSVGLAGALRQPLLMLVPGGLLVLAAVVVLARDRRKASHGDIAPDANSAESTQAIGAWPNRRWLWCAAPFVAAIVLGAALPPIDFDVREYHLQAPKEFYLQGSIGFLPHNVYANMPLGSEMLALAAMAACGDWWLGALIGKTATAMFAIWTSLALFATGRRWFSAGAGVVAALAFISIPWVALVATLGLIDVASAFFLLLSVDALLRWRAARAADRHATSYGALLLAGFLAGSAVAVKYPAALFVVLPLAGWIVLAERRQAWRVLAIYLLAVAVACGPWLAKNGALAGNPVYPLLYSVFDGATRTDAKDAQWRAAHAPPNYSPGDAVNRAADLLLRSPWISPLVVPLVFAALAWRRRTWPVAPLAIYLACVLALWWLFTHRIERFWVPVLPVAALLAGAGATWTDERPWRRAVGAFLGLGLAANLLVVTSGMCGDSRYFAPLAELRDDPQRSPPCHAYLNEHRRDDRAVLAVGDAAVFDLEGPVLYNTAFDDSVFESFVRWAYDERTPEALDALHRELAERVSLVYVRWSEIDRYRAPGNYGYTDFVQPEVFAFLVERKILAPPVAGFAESHVEIYPVLPYAPKSP